MSTRYSAPVRVHPVLTHDSERRSPLESWTFRLDSDDIGQREQWFHDGDQIADPIAVPGCWQGQGFGGEGLETVWDFRLDARTFRATYRGVGWYATRFPSPKLDSSDRVQVLFGGVHPSCDVWLNGHLLGGHRQPFVPFGFDVTDILRADAENDLVARVDESARDLGFAYNWQGAWSGLYRHVEMLITGTARLANVRLNPDAVTGTIRCEVAVDGPIGEDTEIEITVAPAGADTGTGSAARSRIGADSHVSLELGVDDVRLWSPDSPQLYRVDVALVEGDRVLDALSERIGFVTLSMKGKHFCINDEPYYMRGTGEFIAAPETGSPDTDRDRLRRKLKQLRDYGYNYVRFQSYVQAPEYYDVADEVGLLLQSEMGALGGWGGHTQWHGYQWPLPTADNRLELLSQWNNTVLRDVNHPSANLYCMSNEFGRECLFPEVARQCERDTRRIKPTAQVIWTDGGWNPELPGDFVNDEAQIDSECPKPVIQHEFRWWSSLPDVEIEDRYDGAMRPYAQDIAREAARRHGTEHVLAEGARTSQRLQFIEAKCKMEACRRDNPRLAGICHFNAMDTTPSPQGIIDEFFETKYASSDLWRQTNGDTVLMSSLGFHDRVLVPGDAFATDLYVSDFSHPPLESPVTSWRLTAGESVIAEGRLDYPHTPYATVSVGTVSARIPVDIDAPVRATLHAEVSDGARTFDNAWDLWILPDEQGSAPGIVRVGSVHDGWLGTYNLPTVVDAAAIPSGTRVVCSSWIDDRLEEYVRSGGRLILVAGEGLVRPWKAKLGAGDGHYYFTPPANYPPYEDGHDGTIVHQHPALTGLLHEGFADLQFYNLIAKAPPVDLEPLGLNDADPVIRAIHSYPVGRSLGYLVERSLGSGGIIICSLDLQHRFVEGRFLFDRLCDYASTSEDFGPQISEQALYVLKSESRLVSPPMPYFDTQHE